MPVSPTRSCPDCDYDLRGLPLMHNCPECGFEFDPTMTLFRPSRPKPAWIPLIVGAGLAFGWGIGPVALRVFRGGDLVGNLTAGEAFSIITGGLLLTIFGLPLISPRAWRYAIVHQDGLLARRGARKHAVSWDEIRGVWAWPTLSVWVWLTRPPHLLRIHGVFDEFSDARRLAGQLRSRKRMMQRHADRREAD